MSCGSRCCWDRARPPSCRRPAPPPSCRRTGRQCRDGPVPPRRRGPAEWPLERGHRARPVLLAQVEPAELELGGGIVRHLLHDLLGVGEGGVRLALADEDVHVGDARRGEPGIGGEGAPVRQRGLIGVVAGLEDLADGELDLRIAGIEERALLGLGDRVVPALRVAGEDGLAEHGEGLAGLLVRVARLFGLFFRGGGVALAQERHGQLRPCHRQLGIDLERLAELGLGIFGPAHRRAAPRRGRRERCRCWAPAWTARSAVASAVAPSFVRAWARASAACAVALFGAALAASSACVSASRPVL